MIREMGSYLLLGLLAFLAGGCVNQEQNKKEADSLLEEAFWVWHPNGAKVGEVVTFQKEFTLIKVPKNASITITGDNSYVLYVNGKKIGEDSCWETLDNYNITQYLFPGKNIVSAEVIDKGPPGGVFFAGKIDTEDGSYMKILSDKSIDCFKESDKNKCKASEIAPLAGAIWACGMGGGPGKNGVESLKKEFDEGFKDIVQTQVHAKELNIIPTPKKLKDLKENLELVSEKSGDAVIVFSKRDNSRFVAELLNQACMAAINKKIEITGTIPNDKRNVILIGFPQNNPSIKEACEQKNFNISSLPEEGYMIFPFGNKIILTANSEQGLVYALYTFIQTLRKEEKNLIAKKTEIEDYPPAGEKYRGISSRMDKAFGAFYKFNNVRYLIGFSFPLNESMKEMREFLQERGITLALTFHPGNRDLNKKETHFCFSDSEEMQRLYSRVKEGIAYGFKSIEIYQDDYPNSLLDCPECEAKFGKGLNGLTRAQVEMMKNICDIADGKIDILFCPRAYGDIKNPDMQAGSEKNAGDKWWQSRQIISESDLPQSLIMVTTQPKMSYLKELHQIYKGKPVFIFHNTLLPFDARYWFEPYPVVSKDYIEYAQSWSISCIGDPELWRIHLLTFAEAVWNPGSFLPLERAFAAIYGPENAEELLKYSLLTCGSAVPRGVIADCFDVPDDYPQAFLDTGWFGRAYGKNFTTYKPTPENIKHFQQIAMNAESAVLLIDSMKKSLPPITSEKLKLNARRLQLDFEIWTEVLRFKAGEINKETLVKTIPKAKELKDIIVKMKTLGALGEGNADDLEFEKTIRKLIKK